MAKKKVVEIIAAPEGVNCSTCAYWIRDARHVGMEAQDGDCRRHPPQMMYSENEGPFSLWPLVEITDFCGEWRARMNG